MVLVLSRVALESLSRLRVCCISVRDEHSEGFMHGSGTALMGGSTYNFGLFFYLLLSSL